MEQVKCESNPSDQPPQYSLPHTTTTMGGTYGSSPYSPPAQYSHTTIITAPVSQQMDRSLWSSGLCACMTECSSCLLTAFCTVCFTANLATRMGESCLYGYCCAPHFASTARPYFRGKENIVGSLAGDCCIGFWCGCCNICQISRELDRRGYPKGCMC
ncbi:placenta-specific gene 8 protein-like [Styela clava]